MKFTISHLLLFITFFSCNKEITVDIEDPIKEPNAWFTINYPKDANGNYVIAFTDEDYRNRWIHFLLFTEATPLNLPDSLSNRAVKITSGFSSNCFWLLNERESVVIPEYVPFTDPHQSPYYAKPINAGGNLVVLKNSYTVHIFSDTAEGRLKRYDSTSQYRPYKAKPGNFWGKTSVFPLSIALTHNEIKIYGRVTWEIEGSTRKFEKIDSLKILFK